MATPPIYCIDTSSIIKWFVETYTPDVFPGLVDKIEELIAAGRLRSPKAVFDEIRPGDDCHVWAKAQTELFLEEDAPVQRVVAHLMATHRDPAKPLKGIAGADPFVIALAKVNNWIVVSNENPGSAENRKIPYVCLRESVQCVTFHELMRLKGWRFTSG